jgi:membrane protease YdiL (CAAX protease family)
MRAFIRNRSTSQEFGFIMCLCFGWSIVYEVWMKSKSEPFRFRDNALIEATIYEILLLVVVLWIGKVRGWSLAIFGTKISWKGTGMGMLLFVATLAVQIAVYMTAYYVYPEHIGYTSARLSVPIILLVSVVNPVFEEVLESGYLIHTLQKLGMWPAILAGAFLRFFIHIYQGIDGALSISVLGVIFGLAYWKWRQLWPLIIAHSLCDFFGLFNLSR